MLQWSSTSTICVEFFCNIEEVIVQYTVLICDENVIRIVINCKCACARVHNTPPPPCTSKDGAKKSLCKIRNTDMWKFKTSNMKEDVFQVKYQSGGNVECDPKV